MIDLGLLDAPAVRTLMAGAAILASGSLARLWKLRGRRDSAARERRASLIVWWGLLMASGVSAAAGRVGTAILFTIVTAMAYREYVPWVCRDSRDRRIAWLAGVLIPVHYGLIAAGDPAGSLWLMPVGGLMLVGTLLVLSGRPDGFIRTTAGLYWGMMLLVYLPSFTARLVDLSGTPPMSAVGWYLYVMILTPYSDIAQALIGRRWGRHKITPVVSPHKSWEGLVGGAIATGVASICVAPMLTVWQWWPVQSTAETAWAVAAAFLAGVALCVIGFFGDIHLSAVKRDVGIKDSSNLLPGQGGMIDRIDSLTFTGTTFYFFVQWLG